MYFSNSNDRRRTRNHRAHAVTQTGNVYRGIIHMGFYISTPDNHTQATLEKAWVESDDLWVLSPLNRSIRHALLGMAAHLDLGFISPPIWHMVRH